MILTFSRPKQNKQPVFDFSIVFHICVFDPSFMKLRKFLPKVIKLCRTMEAAFGHYNYTMTTPIFCLYTEVIDEKYLDSFADTWAESKTESSASTSKVSYKCGFSTAL